MNQSLIKKLVCLTALSAVMSLSAADKNLNDRNFHFAKGENDRFEFMIDGQKTVLVCGEMHYNRIPRAYWKDRMQRAKAMGLNAISAYVFWGFHERKPGEFTFDDNADIREFVKTAHEEGLLVVLRPGPYVCAEYDFGGYPWWLLNEQDSGMQYRANDPKFIGFCARYLKALGDQLADLQSTRGGPIVMVQVENEYGSYSNNKVYLGKLRDAVKAAGFEVPLMTCDGPGQLPAGQLEGTLPTVNGVTNASIFKTVDRYSPGGPYFSAEFYPAWFDVWGKPHSRKDATAAAQQLKWMLDNRVSVSIYMFHGGTNFWFTNGSNNAGVYAPQPTSYDYDAPLGEYGNMTDKFMKFRNTVGESLKVKLPPLPPQPKTIAIPSFKVTGQGSRWVPLNRFIRDPIRSKEPMSFEALGQNFGYVLYRTRVENAFDGTLTVKKLRDFGVVCVNGKIIGELDRRTGKESISAVIPAGAQLDIWVENVGRINYGHVMLDNHKGILDGVWLDDTRCQNFENYTFPLTPEHFASITQNQPKIAAAIAPDTAQPGIFFTTFTINQKPEDTFLDMRGWGKGALFINGHSIGKFWYIGPQQTYYVPGCWLKEGVNTLAIMELSPQGMETVEFLDQPILNEVKPDKNIRPKKIRTGVAPKLESGDKLLSVTLTPGPDEQKFAFQEVQTLRHLCLKLKSGFNADPFAALAEVKVYDADGKQIKPNKSWTIQYLSSEENQKEEAVGENLFDGNSGTLWHSRYHNNPAPFPHVIVIDMGEIHQVKSVGIQQRKDSVNGKIRDLDLFGRAQFFLND